MQSNFRNGFEKRSTTEPDIHPSLRAINNSESPPLPSHILLGSLTNSSTISNPQIASQQSFRTDEDDEQNVAGRAFLMDTDTYLYSRLSKALIKGTHLPHFLPRGDLDRLITTESIKTELLKTGCITKGYSDRKLDDLVDFVLNRAKKCFAILVFINKVPEIKTFYQNSFTDEHLPVAFEFPDGKCEAKALNRDFDYLDVKPLTKCFKDPWNHQDLDAFAEKQ
jgi:hypothetical protein